VTVSVNGGQAFSYTFAPRILNGETVGLNKGFVGVGSNNARGVFDNIAVQALPPQLTLDANEDFNDGLAQQFTGDQAGTWTVTSGGRYVSTAATATTTLDTLSLGARFQPTSYTELSATLNTTGIGGISFDEYATNDFKYVALDIAAQKIDIGHVDPRRGWVVDASVAKALVAGTNYSLMVTLSGTAVSVSLGGTFLTSFSYAGAVVDGAAGVLSRSGTSSFDTYRLRTNDPAFTTPSLWIGNASVVEGNSGTTPATLTLTLSGPSIAATSVSWATAAGSAAAGVDYTTASGSVTFAPGETVKTITVSVLGDTLKEANETFTVNLSNPAALSIAGGSGTVTIIDNESPQRAATAGPGASAADLTASQLAAVVVQAEALWQAAYPSADFSGVTFSIAPLGGLLLGVTGGREITIDATAAGWGWSVSHPSGPGPRMDLLTVVLHELGHTLGLDDDATQGLMGEFLTAGATRGLAPAPLLGPRVGGAGTTILGTPARSWLVSTQTGRIAAPAAGSIRLLHPIALRAHRLQLHGTPAATRGKTKGRKYSA